MNQRNFGIVEGRLTREPKVFENENGSKKVVLTLATKRNYKNSDGKVESDFVGLEGFVAPNAKGLGVYDYMHKGDLVGAEYTVRTGSYTDKNGEEQYTQALFIQSIDLKESKSTTQARQSASQQDVPAPETAMAPEDSPFAD